MAFKVYTVSDPGTPRSFYWGTGNTSGNFGRGKKLLHEYGKRWSTETWNVKFTVYCDMVSHLLVVLQHCCYMVWAHTFVYLQDWPGVVKWFYFDVMHLILMFYTTTYKESARHVPSTHKHAPHLTNMLITARRSSAEWNEKHDNPKYFLHIASNAWITAVHVTF